MFSKNTHPMCGGSRVRSSNEIRRWFQRIVGVVLLSSMGANFAHADFYRALKNYKDGKFEEAANEFLSLAELGDGPSQQNLGVMAARGESLPKDAGMGVGWMLAAAENGYGQVSPAKLAEFRSKLNPEQDAAALKIVAQYGAKAMQDKVLPSGNWPQGCPSFTPAKAEHMAIMDPARDLRIRDQVGIVAVAFVIGVDGIPRDPQIIAALPQGVLEDVTMDTLLRSRFHPAERNGVPIVTRMTIRIRFGLPQGSSLLVNGAVQKLKAEADKGNPYSKHVLGVFGTLDSSLNIPPDKARSMIVSAAQAGIAPAQYWVVYQALHEKLCDDNDKYRIWLEHAAKGGEPAAQIDYVRMRLSQNPNDNEYAELAKILREAAMSDDFYAIKHAAAILASTNEKIADKQLALQTAVRLQKFDPLLDPQVNDVIARVYAANNNFADAATQQDLAVKKAKRLGWNTKTAEERLAAYRQGRLLGDSLAVLLPTGMNP